MFDDVTVFVNAADVIGFVFVGVLLLVAGAIISYLLVVQWWEERKKGKPPNRGAH